jgi:hypothetical protein
MTTRVYCITTGDYDSYRIVAFIEGPARPALSTLRKQFDALYGVPRENAPLVKATEIMLHVTAEVNAEERLKKAGYGRNIGEAFVAWLKREHGFVEANVSEVHV